MHQSVFVDIPVYKHNLQITETVGCPNTFIIRRFHCYVQTSMCRLTCTLCVWYNQYITGLFAKTTFIIFCLVMLSLFSVMVRTHLSSLVLDLTCVSCLQFSFGFKKTVGVPIPDENSLFPRDEYVCVCVCWVCVY